MKRKCNLFNDICSIENLELADIKARKGKRDSDGVLSHDKEKEINTLNLHNSLLNKTFKTSKYKHFKIFETKERIISG